MNSFYVYIYLDPRKPGKFHYGEYCFDYEPFYVGKGKDNRMFTKICKKCGEDFETKGPRKKYCNNCK
jgi:hypothetical protein